MKRRKPPPARTRLAEAQNWRCAYCTGSMSMQKPGPFLATREHLVAISRGGDDDWMNLVAACKACNETRDTDLSPEVFHRHRMALVHSGVWPPGHAPGDRVKIFFGHLCADQKRDAARAEQVLRRQGRRALHKLRAAHAREERREGW